MSTSQPRASPSFSPRTMTFLRRWPSSARRAGCGPVCCRSNSALRACQALRFHAQTAGSTLTAQQPENNLARTALQALSAVLGGTQSLHVNGYDEALALPSEESARLALRTQQILAKESGVAQTVDPLAGSYYVESLTTAIEQEARSYLERIDALGGMVAAIERGWVQREIEEAAYRHQQAVDAGETVVVGVNRSPVPARTSPAVPAMSTKRRNGGRSSGYAPCAPAAIRCAGRRRSTGSRSRPAPPET